MSIVPNGGEISIAPRCVAAFGDGHGHGHDVVDTRPLVVIPCHNEEKRLDPIRLRVLSESGRVRLLFVDDGSTDGTSAVLDRFARTSDDVGAC